MEDKSLFKGNNSSDVDATYINDCIKEVCINGDSLTKYKRMIEKLYGVEFYQQCGDFVKEVKRSASRKKFTNTSIASLKYLAGLINVSESTVETIVDTLLEQGKELDEEKPEPTPPSSRNKTTKSPFIFSGTNEYPYEGLTLWPNPKKSIPSDLIIPERDGSENIVVVDGFEGVSSIRSIVFKQRRVLYIREGAFRNCINLETVTFEAIPNLYIKSGAFEGCSHLSSLTFEEKYYPPHVHSKAFEGCALPFKTRLKLMKYHLENDFF